MASTTIQEVARETLDWFETATKTTDGETRYVRMKDEAPGWVQDLVWDAHGDFFPDDWRYDCIHHALQFIADDEGDPEDWAHAFADGHADVYNGARLAWVASNLNRAGYVDEAREEGLIGPDADLFTQLGVGQYEEASEVFHSVRESLEARVEVLA